MENDLETWLPILNLCLGLFGFAWLWLRTGKRRHEYPREVMLNMEMTLVLFFALLCTSGEMIVRTAKDGDVPLLSAVVIFCAKVFTLTVLWRTHGTKYRTGTRTENGNDGEDQDLDV